MSGAVGCAALAGLRAAGATGPDAPAAPAALVPTGCVVKLCGMSREADIDAVAAARPDLVGFIVDFPRSHRSVSAARLAELVSYLRKRDPERAIGAVGVFVDEPPERVAAVARAAGLDAAQLHGHEDAAYLERLRPLLSAGVALIQAFRVCSAADVARARASAADLILLDNGQGTGEAFDWSLIHGIGRSFLLAGGLAPGNVAGAIRAVRPWGVDMSSGIETDRVKDPVKIAAAVRAVREAVPLPAAIPSAAATTPSAPAPVP